MQRITNENPTTWKVDLLSHRKRKKKRQPTIRSFLSDLFHLQLFRKKKKEVTSGMNATFDRQYFFHCLYTTINSIFVFSFSFYPHVYLHKIKAVKLLVFSMTRSFCWFASKVRRNRQGNLLKFRLSVKLKLMNHWDL